MVLSILEDTRLQGAGTQGKVQGMGGVTLELEVLTAGDIAAPRTAMG